MRDSVLRFVYEIIRRNSSLNYFAHRLIQSELLNIFPPYKAVYRNFIEHKSKKLLMSPSILELSITDICNARCVMCPPQVHQGRTIMTNELFEKIAREGADVGIKQMVLTGGEALIDKDLEKKISFAKGLGYEVQLFTNGQLMDEKRSESILASGLDKLTWSIDSANEDEYQKIRVGLDFNVVTNNVRRFMEIRNHAGSKTPLTRINMVALSQNKESRKEFRQFFSSWVDIVEIIDAHNWGDEGFLENVSSEYTQKCRYPCHLLFLKFVVWPDGIVRKCSIDYGSEAKTGDMNKDSIRDILKSEKVCKLKMKHLQYDFGAPGCDVCTFKESWWVKAV